MSGAVSHSLVTVWQQAVEAVDQGRLDAAERLLWDVRHHSAKIWFNLAVIHLLRGDLGAADQKLEECLQKDGYLAVAYFQRGVIACLQGRLVQAQEMFGCAEKNVRDGDLIDYRQLGLALRLTLQQIQHNQKAVENHLRGNRAMTKMLEEKLEILPLALFRPGKSLVDNLHKRQFLQKAKVISSVPEFSHGIEERLTRGQTTPTSTPPGQRRSHQGAPPPPPPPSRPPPRLMPSQQLSHHGNSEKSVPSATARSEHQHHGGGAAWKNSRHPWRSDQVTENGGKGSERSPVSAAPSKVKPPRPPPPTFCP